MTMNWSSITNTGQAQTVLQQVLKGFITFLFGKATIFNITYLKSIYSSLPVKHLHKIKTKSQLSVAIVGQGVLQADTATTLNL